MALDSDRDDDRTADDTTRTQPAMGGKGTRQAAPPTDDDEPDDVAERIRAATAKANREAKDYRLKAKELEAKLAEIEAAEREKADAALPEIDKLTKRVQAREAEIAERQADLEAIADAYDALKVKFAAFQAGAVKVRPERMDAVLRLLDLDAIDRDDETGAPIGIDKAIDAVLKDYHEFAATQAKGTPVPSRNGNGTPPRRGMNGGNGGDGDISIRDYLRATGSGGF